jgi:hypothetical protein
LACSVDRFKICRGKGNRVYLERWNQRCVPRY